MSWRAISMGIAAVLIVGFILGGGALRSKRSSGITDPMASDRRQPGTAVVSNEASQAKPAGPDVVAVWEEDNEASQAKPTGPDVVAVWERDDVTISDDSELANLATEATKMAAPPRTLTETDFDRVLQSVDTWRAAWQAQFVAGYVDHYTAAFRPANGQSHDAWVRDRQVKLTQPKTISVRLENLEIKRLDNQRYKVTFRQRYQSDTHQDVVTKELMLIKAGDYYLIEKERVLQSKNYE